MNSSSHSPSPQPDSLEHTQPRPSLDQDATTQHGFNSCDILRDDDGDDGSSSAPTVLNPSELEHHVEPRYVRANRKPPRNHNRPDALTTHKSGGVTSDQDSDSQQDHPYSWISLLPHEALTRILAHLDPTSLARAAAVSRLWHAIVKDDVTWRQALCNSFAISQNDGSGASIALRRTNKSSWKAEYIHRTDLIKRWKRSRAPAISSDMRVSNISAIAFADMHSFLISASLNHGIASRSDPFKGKVARGFLDAAGALGNAAAAHPPPHLDPSPGITAVALSRDASRVLWGFHDGTISITLLTRQGSNPRALIRTIRLSSTGAHTGPVTALAFDLNQRGQTRRQHRRVAMADAADCFATGGQDGRVRLWTHNSHLPIWFASTQDDGAPADQPRNVLAAITQIDLDADLGIVVAGTKAGDVHIWSGINVASLLSISSSAWDSHAAEIQNAAQIQARKAIALEHARVRHVAFKSTEDPAHQAHIDSGAQDFDASIDHLFLDTSTDGEINVIVHRGPDPHLALHRLSFSNDLQQDISRQTHILETDSPLDAITCLRVDCAPASIVEHSATGTPQHSATPSPALAPVTLPDGSAPLPSVILGPAPGSTRNLHGGVFAERRFVCAGTSNGNLFGWPIPASDTTTTHLRPNFKLDCHHTALTSVDFTPHLFAVGTSDGTVQSFNSLTGEPVRTWNERTATRHAARMLDQGTLTVDEANRFRVKQIIIGPESIVAAIGPFLLAWRPGSATSGRRNKGNGPGGISSAATSSGGTPGKATPGRSAIPPLSKYAQMREIRAELAESSAALAKEKEQRQASYDRIKYTRATADIGGLNEDEAIEYAMMLSREEEEARQVSEAHRNDEAQSHLSELARIKKEETELQEALEQIALAEGDDSMYSSGVPSSRASDAGASPPDDEDRDEYAFDSKDEYYDDEDYDASQHRRTSLSPGPSPGLSGYGSPTRAWSILNNAGSSASASPATSRSRWGDNTKVRMVSVPRSSRLSLSPSAGNTPPPPLSAPDTSMLSSPEHWPTMSTSLSSSGGRSPLAEGSFSLGPSRIPTSSYGFSSKPSPQQPPSASTSQDEGFRSNISKGKRPQSNLSAPSPLASPSPLAPCPATASSPAIKGAWAKGSPQVKPSPPGQASSGSFADAAAASPSTPSTLSRPAAVPLDDMDDDLRFAIELSLAEERSRGSSQ